MSTAKIIQFSAIIAQLSSARLCPVVTDGQLRLRLAILCLIERDLWAIIGCQRRLIAAIQDYRDCFLLSQALPAPD